MTNPIDPTNNEDTNKETTMPEDINPINTIVPKEDTTMDVMSPTKFHIFFRPNSDSDWDLEDEVDTKIQALHYINRAKIVSGEFKVTSTMDPDILININYTKEEKVYEYTKEIAMPHPDGDGRKVYNEKITMVVVTNTLNKADAKSLAIYHQAAADNKLGIVRKFQLEGGVGPCVPMFTSTTWTRPLLTERIAKIGGKYRVETYSHVSTLNQMVLNERIEKSSFSFVEGDDLVVFFVVDENNKKVTWDEFPGYLGLEFRNSKKFGKRAKELTRLTLPWTMRTKKLNIHYLPVSPELEIAVDGNGAMSMSLALEMADSIPEVKARNRYKARIHNGEIVRVNFRALTDQGILKGDRIIVPDEVLYNKYGYVPDLVEHTVDGVVINLKPEIRTDGTYTLVTMNPHHASKAPMTNDQLLACISKNGTWFLEEDKLKEDHKSFVDEMYEELAAGKFPKYMEAEWVSSSSGNIKQDPSRIAERFQQLSVEYYANRYKYSPAPLLESGFMIARVAQGIEMRLAKPVYTKNKIMVPIRHAAYLHITTMSIITSCGFDPEEDGYDTTKSFYYPKAHSWVAPDQVFTDNYARHGGYDGDDSLIVTIVNMEYGDGSVKQMAIQTRMPMAWGEYSIVEVDTTDFPFYNTWNEMLTVKYDDRPEFLEEMEQVITGLEFSDVEVPETYDMGWSKYQLKLAVINPGVGRVINPMIAFYATALTYFPQQLASTEDFVDTLMQTPDEMAFLAIAGEIDNMISQVLTAGMPIDEHIWDTRLKGARQGDATIVSDSFYKRMMTFTENVLANFSKRTKHLSTHGRLVIQEVMDMVLPETIMVTKHGEDVEYNTKAYAASIIKHFDKKQNKASGHPEGEQRREFYGKLNRYYVNSLMNQKARDIILLAIYQDIIINNRKDNILFQTPWMADERSVMHLWLIALHNHGLADLHIIAEDGSVTVRHPMIKTS